MKKAVDKEERERGEEEGKRRTKERGKALSPPYIINTVYCTRKEKDERERKGPIPPVYYQYCLLHILPQKESPGKGHNVSIDFFHILFSHTDKSGLCRHDFPIYL